jgi:hypothetical protein
MIFMLKDHRAHLKSLIKRGNKYPRFWNLFHPLLHFLSTQKFVTVLTGPFYERSRYQIEIDITYACNLKCFNCNRSCGLAPSDDRLSLEQIPKFLRESTAKGIHWESIRILGGEPTLHPEFLQIIDELIAFKDSQCPAVVIEIVTNGFGKKVNDVIKKLSSKVVVDNTAKKSIEQEFIRFNLAPKDFVRYRFADYSSGCWVPQDCGIGLSPYGYYPCTVAAAIDRVLGFDIRKKITARVRRPHAGSDGSSLQILRIFDILQVHINR